MQAAPVPAEMRNSFFAVTVNNQRVDVAHAASQLRVRQLRHHRAGGDLDYRGRPAFLGSAASISSRGGWDCAPTHPEGEPQTIRFRLPGPAKLSISRPGDFLNHARMLFLFAGSPPPPPPSGPNVTIVPAGVHRESLNPKSGDTIYLAPGAFVFGSLNLWQVENVKVLGRGTIVYDGPQDPNGDKGWMQKPDWHCIVAYQAHNVEIDGLTCIIRSRTWSIQMKDSTGFRYDDLRVIGGNPGNANQDGMDWLGGGDTVVNHSFFRASDDDLAMQGNWDGYTEADMLRPGADVDNILVENSEFSTSISNIVRMGWPQKIFNSRNFTLRDSDILHGGIGACGQTFGLLGFWGANGASGDHSGVTFENLFLDNWYSLAQMEQEQPSLHGFTFRNIWALDQPPLAESTITGDVKRRDLRQREVRADARDQRRADAAGGFRRRGAACVSRRRPRWRRLSASIRRSFAPRQKVTFTAQAAPGAQYTWLFGDGTTAHGRRVRHRFPDALGTELDGQKWRGTLPRSAARDGQGRPSGLGGAGSGGRRAMARCGECKRCRPSDAGPGWKIYRRHVDRAARLLQRCSRHSPAQSAESRRPARRDFTRYATAWDGFIEIPADGGYTFHLIDRDGARLVIDGMEVAKTGPPFAQVCGSPGNALRYDRGSLGLRAGLHAIHVEALNTASDGAPRLMWEGPGTPLADVPAAAFSQSAP